MYGCEVESPADGGKQGGMAWHTSYDDDGKGIAPIDPSIECLNSACSLVACHVFQV